MKFAAAVLRNKFNAVSAVRYHAVTDALLSGGVPLEEVALLAYDDPTLVVESLRRLIGGYEGVFLVCDKILVPSAREAIHAASGITLDGDYAATDDRFVALLPAGERGAALVKDIVIPAIDARRRQSYHSVVLRTVSAPPERLLRAVADAQDEAGDRLTIRTSEEYGVGRIEVVYDKDTPKVVADEVVRLLASELEHYLYAMEDVDISARLFEALKLHRIKISTAESFTGGGVASAIISNAGASKVFYEGIVCYDESSKEERLGVAEYTIKSKGAASDETAYEMAVGLLKEGKCDLAIATTGVAGPLSDGSGKPAGTCYLAVGTQERVRVYEFHLEGDRESVTKRAVNLALFLAYKEIA